MNSSVWAVWAAQAVRKKSGFELGGVHKLRLQEEGGRWSKKLTFCKPLYHRKCKRRGVGGQKKPNLVNVVCERPLNSKFEGVKTFYQILLETLKSKLPKPLRCSIARHEPNTCRTDSSHNGVNQFLKRVM